MGRGETAARVGVVWRVARVVRVVVRARVRMRARARVRLTRGKEGDQAIS